MKTTQIALKEIIVNMFLESFDTLDNIMLLLNINEEDAKAITESIEQDFIAECK